MADTIQDLVTLTQIVKDNFDLSYAESLAGSDNWAATLTDMDIPVVGDDHVNYPFLLHQAGIHASAIGQPPPYEYPSGLHTSVNLQKFAGGVAISQVHFSNPFYQNLLMKDVDGLGIEASFLPLERLCRALVNGDTDPYYTVWDGQQFFSTAHTLAANWSNLFSGALNRANFITVKSNMRRIPWKIVDGELKYLPMNGASWYLIVPPELKYVAQELIAPTWYMNSGTGVGESALANEATVISDERLSDTNDWYLACTLAGKKPFVHAINTEVGNRELVPEMESWSDAVKNHDEYRWSLKTFEELFPGLFYLVTKVTNAGGTLPTS